MSDTQTLTLQNHAKVHFCEDHVDFVLLNFPSHHASLDSCLERLIPATFINCRQVSSLLFKSTYRILGHL